ncbi:TonB-dependent receptor [Flavobacterium crassostreae]|uniref:TonB-dependent receptor n=1 Tax=Flavobacterium crassostreae TaxID=1763534 RepID=A0A1B9E3F1_9FLAO|nr:TonB-dependent receptor [Flavobacterium crassostreae]OCB76457.1 TonB-dependent receptor [Flavobacterium crassostreae]
MNFNLQNKVFIPLLLLAFQFSFAQKKNATIGSEVVNVVKPYSPTISDAFKVPEIAVLEEEGNAQKETVQYTIFSFPVASTFTPSKGKAEGVVRTKPPHLYSNYATLGFGSYSTLQAALYVNQELGNADYVGAMFRHLSSQGGISGVTLKDAFYDTAIDLTYGANYKDLAWNVDVGYQNQIYNWYGLPVLFGSTLSEDNRKDLLNSIHPEHAFNAFSAGGKMEFSEGIFKKAKAKFHHFADSFGSVENRFYVAPTLELDLMEERIKTNITIDYLGGSFANNYANTNAIKYGFTNLGIAPSFVMQKDDWTIDLGAAVFYSLDNQNNKNKLFVYPQINATYKVVGDLMVFYAGAQGDLQQNTYSDFANQNSFVSPTLLIAPTDKQYDIFAGLKGKLIQNVSYNVRGSYKNEKNKALFKSNDYTETSTNDPYGFGNSFQVVYDDVRTVSFSGDLKAAFSENVSFGISGAFSSYSNANQSEAWNLPQITLNTNLEVTITPKWYAGATVFYVGQRKDAQTNTSLTTTATNITLGSYLDANAHLGYKYNQRLTGFLKANNFANQNYQKWANYPVQGFQIMIGANYKFDF